MKNKKVILISLLILITLMVIIVIMNIFNKKSNNAVSSNSHITTEEEENQKEIEELKNMGEIGRMQFYVSKYISYIEAGDYESAYSLLYQEFKNKYFPTQDDFEKYIKRKYPDIITLTYNNVERLGTYYVLTVSCSDLVNNEKSFTQKFVVKENGFNDFVMSFQAE